MSADVIERSVEKVKELYPEGTDLLAAAGITDRPFRLSDAMRMGSKVAGQAYSWTDTEGNLCALSAAAVAAKAHGLI